MKTKNLLFLLTIALMVGCTPIHSEQNNGLERNHIGDGVSEIKYKGHEYLGYWGECLIHSQSCPCLVKSIE